ncbi:acetoacetate--CoA ligase [Vibrio sp. SCSIO 43136]|uniref:acetoacetate--CoA ligase n=1 Tax=Vibrio sp. SCSIO 43136 TaxID=2819101 RepID=UPI0020752CAE|nr:acetoacetate--CoA ligase [Vibrio sp. SCSIO 43136]USD67819.1 acetoacetate--CoA ligase [Vibrio sp. SCSIO 43136]
MDERTPPLWTPSEQRIERALLTQFLARVDVEHGLHMQNYDELHQWSVENPDLFWETLWRFADIIGTQGNNTCQLGPAKFEHPIEARDTIWFEDSVLNYTENLLAQAFHTPNKVAIYCENERAESQEITWQSLCDQVSVATQWLEDCHVGVGDVVAGYLPNIAETLIAMLATAARGAIWTSTSPDFGVESVVERFGQVKPKVLFVVDGYTFNGQAHTMRDKNHQLATALDSVEQVCQINYLHPNSEDGFAEWHHIQQGYQAKAMRYERVSFNSPLFILYSSGTTGKPKCIIHSVGGTLLNLVKEHQLHCDIHAIDTVFYYTTCGWMMWNWLTGALASGASIVLYDGQPCYPDNQTLWTMAEKHEVSLFGTSAKYLEAIEKFNYQPVKHHDLSSLKTLCSTGSVLHPNQFDFVYHSIKQDLHLASISGGTDICGCFVLGNPISPVYRGECQQAGLGLSVKAFDANGNAVLNTQGELVCTNSFPNQPIGFSNDNGERYHNAYWAKFANAWHHGDEVSQSSHLGFQFYGRSDAVLNRGGIRIGSAEIYQQINKLEGVIDSVVVGQRGASGDERMVLFVQTESGRVLSHEMISEIKSSLRTHCSPRHEPDLVLPIGEVPRTKSGKLVEIAVKQILEGKVVENEGAIANPESLDEIRSMQPHWRA